MEALDLDSNRRADPATAGFRVGSTAEFLALEPEEEALIELKLVLGSTVKQWRTHRRLSQVGLARRIGSSQSRVAKMESGDPGVSLDLMMRALLSLGATPRDLGEAISS